MVYHIAGLETEQRHSCHAQRGYRDFSRLVRSDRIIVIIQEFHYHEFRLKMPAVEVFTVRERVLHLGGSVCGIELEFRPFLMDNLPQCVQFESLRVTQGFADADAFLHGAVPVIDAMFFSKRDELNEKRRHCHAHGRMDAVNRIPLEFRYSVADTHHAHAKFARPHEVCESCHETAVDRHHFLHDVVPGAAGGLK